MGDICDNGLSGFEDAKFLQEVSASSKKSKFFWNSIYFNDDTPKSKKKTMQSSELESDLPDEAELEMVEKDIGIFILKKIPNGLSQKTVHLVLWKMQVQCYIKNIL